jgi:hypothetical protein
MKISSAFSLRNRVLKQALACAMAVVFALVQVLPMPGLQGTAWAQEAERNEMGSYVPVKDALAPLPQALGVEEPAGKAALGYLESLHSTPLSPAMADQTSDYSGVTGTHDRYTMSQAVDEFADQDAPVALVLGHAPNAEELKRLLTLKPFEEIAGAVLHGEVVLFNTNRQREVGVTAKAEAIIQSEADVVFHTHRAVVDPSQFDKEHASEGPRLEYVVSPDEVIGYNRDGEKVRLDLEAFARVLEEAWHKGEAQRDTQWARKLLNELVAEFEHAGIEDLVSFRRENQPPVITLPEEIVTTEGDAVVIPFTVHEPNNDVVEYSIERMIGDQVQPSLPTGAVFETDLLTAERRLIWWPSLSQEGIYDFRFTATDDEGLSAEKTVQVTVQDRTGVPAIVNAQASTPMTVQHPETRGPILPEETIVISEGKTFAIAFNLADPEDEAVTVTVNGLPGATLSKKGSDWLVNWSPGTSHVNVGMHQAILTATDTQGNQSTLSFAVDVRRDFNGQAEAVEIHPFVQSGLVRATETRSDAEVTIVRGNVTLGVRSYRSWGGSPTGPNFSFPPGMRYRYVQHAPDGQGNDVRTYLSDVLTGQQSITWDSTTIPDGTYVVDVQIVEPDPQDSLETAIERFYRLPLYIVVDNATGPVTGPQWQPSVGFVGMRSRWTEATAVDWVYSRALPNCLKSSPGRMSRPPRRRPMPSGWRSLQTTSQTAARGLSRRGTRYITLALTWSRTLSARRRGISSTAAGSRTGPRNLTGSGVTREWMEDGIRVVL